MKEEPITMEKSRTKEEPIVAKTLRRKDNPIPESFSENRSKCHSQQDPITVYNSNRLYFNSLKTCVRIYTL
jgi:hypothetical protein